MRLKLYLVEIEREAGWSQCHIVAESEERAADLVIGYESTLPNERFQLDIERVDETLPYDRCMALDDMLEEGAVGLASYSQTVGWIAHAGTMQRLRFFRIEDIKESQTFVIAPNPDIASALYAVSNPLAEGERRLIKIFDAFADAPAEGIASLRYLLEVGPIGIISFDSEDGWSVS